MARRRTASTPNPAGAKPGGESTARPDAYSPAVGWSCALLGLVICAILLYKNGGWSLFRARMGMGFEEYYLFNIALLLWPPILLILYGFKRDLSEFGLQAGDLKRGVLLALGGAILFLPVLIVVAPRPEFQDYYLYTLSQSGAVTGLSYSGGHPTGGHIDWGRLAFYELTLGFYMLAWEWFFRGFLLFGTKKAFPVWVAALFQALLFCLLHLGKPPIEVASSLLGGLVLAVVAIRLRSILPCFLIHFLISLSNDAAVLASHFR